MTGHVDVVADPDADVRWQEWRARGAASDQRTATRTRYVALLVVAALALWFVVRLT